MADTKFTEKRDVLYDFLIDLRDSFMSTDHFRGNNFAEDAIRHPGDIEGIQGARNQVYNLIDRLEYEKNTGNYAVKNEAQLKTLAEDMLSKLRDVRAKQEVEGFARWDCQPVDIMSRYLIDGTLPENLMVDKQRENPAITDFKNKADESHKESPVHDELNFKGVTKNYEEHASDLYSRILELEDDGMRTARHTNGSRIENEKKAFLKDVENYTKIARERNMTSAPAYQAKYVDDYNKRASIMRPLPPNMQLYSDAETFKTSNARPEFRASSWEALEQLHEIKEDFGKAKFSSKDKKIADDILKDVDELIYAIESDNRPQLKDRSYHDRMGQAIQYALDTKYQPQPREDGIVSPGINQVALDNSSGKSSSFIG